MTTDIHALCKHEIIRRDSELSALQNENAELKDANRRANAAIGDTSNELQEIINSLRTQNRELREAIESAANGLSAIYSEPRRYIEMQLRVRDNLNKAIALQPEK